ncbi:MAG: hypothetical protein WBX25_25575, partial [Rhodomicrobium sp.]
TVSGSAVVFCSLSLLIRGHQRARRQAEIPPTAPSEIVEPLLKAKCEFFGIFQFRLISAL